MRARAEPTQTSRAVEADPRVAIGDASSIPIDWRGPQPGRALLLVPTTQVDPRVGPCVTIRVSGFSDQKITFRSCLSIGPGWIVCSLAADHSRGPDAAEAGTPAGWVATEPGRDARVFAGSSVLIIRSRSLSVVRISRVSPLSASL